MVTYFDFRKNSICFYFSVLLFFSLKKGQEILELKQFAIPYILK